MKTIKFTPYRKALGAIYERQTKDKRLLSKDGRYQFLLDDGVEEADFWVVQGKGIRRPTTCRVAPQNTIMLTTEPRSVLVYPNKYLQQFGMVCTCQEQTTHPHIHFGPAILPWFVGFTEEADGTCHYTLDYNQLHQPSQPQDKTKLLSVITSNKAFTRGHLDRIKFVEKLKNHYGDKIDIFGRGFRDFQDKWDVLRPYKYHIAIENSSQRYYWTEKISDCYLAETFPLYYGCTNLSDYFPQEAFVAIDIRQPEQAIAQIDAAIDSKRFEQSTALLADCKMKVLDKYNMFEYAANLCDTMDANAPKQAVTIQPCKTGLELENLFNYNLKRHYYEFLTKLHYWSNGNVLKSKG